MHRTYMLLALQLAQEGRCTVSPNPMVGCVLVKDNCIVGQGFHKKAGDHHAEVNALLDAGNQAEGATAYVTLEPCCHYGRTPPCTNALIQAGIKKVYVACLDPNPLVSGKGIEKLCAAGIEVEVGLCEQEAKKLNEIFFYYVTHHRPFVIAKWAMSLDGKTVVVKKDDRKISGDESHRHVHEMRETVDAILIGANTARVDNPMLNVRLADRVAAKQPVRIVLTTRGDLPNDLSLISQSSSQKTWIIATEPCEKNYPKHVEVIVIAKDKYGKVSLVDLLSELGRRKITSLLVEGGEQVHSRFIQENLVNKVNVYLAPVLISGLENKKKIQINHHSKKGDDVFFEGEMNV